MGVPMQERLTLKHHLTATALVAAWSLFTVVSYTVTAFESSRSRGREFSLYNDALPYLICFCVWIVLAPIMLALCHRFPFRRDRWHSFASIHFAAGLGLGALRAFMANYLINTIYDANNLLFAFGSSFLGGTTYWMFLVAYSGYVYYLRFQDREIRATRLESELARAQVQALKMQIHPHFLFNTLNTIASLNHHDVAKANRMISRLSDLLRITLDSFDRQVVTLKEEADFVAKYLDIEKVRFEDRLEVDVDIPSETLGAYVPSLILQPIVENAVRHGVGRIAAGGRIAVRAERRNASLCVTVIDNGPGLPEGGGEAEPHLGLANTRSRLEKMYGREGRVEIVEPAGGGLEVRVHLPFRTGPMPGNAADGSFPAKGD